MINTIEQVVDDFTRIVKIDEAWDKRSDDPGKNYGIRGVEMHFGLRGEKLTVVFTLFTNWMLPTRESYVLEERFQNPMPAEVSFHYHSKRKDKTYFSKCDWTKGKCWVSSGALIANDVYNALRTGGADGMWKKLEEFYNECA